MVVLRGFGIRRLGHREQILFSDDRHLEFLGLGQLAARVLSGDQKIGFLRDAAGRLATMLPDEFLDFLASELGQSAGDNNGLSLEDSWIAGVVCPGDGFPLMQAELSEIGHDRPARDGVEKTMNAVGDHRANIVHLGQLLGRLACNGFK